MKLNYRYQTDRVPIMIKTRYDNNVTNYTNVVYKIKKKKKKKKTKLS